MPVFGVTKTASNQAVGCGVHTGGVANGHVRIVAWGASGFMPRTTAVPTFVVRLTNVTSSGSALTAVPFDPEATSTRGIGRDNDLAIGDERGANPVDQLIETHTVTGWSFSIVRSYLPGEEPIVRGGDSTRDLSVQISCTGEGTAARYASWIQWEAL